MKSPKDTQITELAGRNRLASELQRAGIEVARPERDHGVDLVAFLDNGTFRACPIQMKVASRERFDVQRKYADFPELKLVYVWDVEKDKSSYFVLSYTDAENVAEQMGWTKTRSWRGEIKGPAGYGTRHVGEALRKRLESYKVTAPDDWKRRLFP
ncbi:MAG: hypothetical protein LAN83_12675 [Acidobacteriia bacterium]|nr:hypothetical protein [Terriglobia bacterium]